MEIHELRQDLIQRTNNNSFYNRGTNTEQCYKAYANEVIEWPISEVKKQKILDNLYKKYSKILEYESQHVPVMVAGPAKYNSKRLDKSEQILKASHELSEWFEDLRKQVENAKKDDSKEEKVKLFFENANVHWKPNKARNRVKRTDNWEKPRKEWEIRKEGFSV